MNKNSKINYENMTSKTKPSKEYESNETKCSKITEPVKADKCMGTPYTAVNSKEDSRLNRKTNKNA